MKDLVADAERQNFWDHPDPLLRKWYCPKQRGVVDAASHFHGETWNTSVKSDGNKFENAGKSTLLDKSQSASSVKQQVPALEPLRARTLTMKASKTMLERRLAEGQDVATVLEMQAAENHLLNSKVSEMTTATDSLAAHIKVMRTAIAKVDALADGAGSGPLVAHADTVESCTNAHLDGGKLLIALL